MRARIVIDRVLFHRGRARQADDEKRQKSHRAEQEGEDEAGQDEEMGDSLVPRRPYFPRTNEEIEGEVVQPSGKQHPRIAEEHADLR